MLCRNCNYILNGKENFCPNCGTIPLTAAQSFPTIKKIPPEAPPAPEEKSASPEKTPDKKDFQFTGANNGIFVHNEEDFSGPDDEPEELLPQKKKSTAKIFILLFLCCALATTAFALADYFGIIPDLTSIASNFTADNEQKQFPSFNHTETVIEPEINYPMTTAYVLTGNGLTLRKGPGNGYAPLYALTDLTQVQIFGGSLANTNWLYVYCGEKESYGWLDGSYVCSETVAENELTSEYASEEEVPTAYYRNEE